jgi:TolB protein
VTQLTFGHFIDTEPAWSHDGQRILFTSDRTGSPQIYQLTLSSGQVTRMTFGRNYAARARWVGPSDHGFVMLGRENDRYAIIYHNMVSGNERVLSATGTEESPSVAANGRMIAYAWQDHGQSILGMVSIDGEVKLSLPSKRGEVYEPVLGGFVTS